MRAYAHSRFRVWLNRYASRFVRGVLGRAPVVNAVSSQNGLEGVTTESGTVVRHDPFDANAERLVVRQEDRDRAGGPLAASQLLAEV